MFGAVTDCKISNRILQENQGLQPMGEGFAKMDF
jgi:hypothetical protein